MLSAISLSSCSWLDVNDNPNYPTSVTPKSILPAGQMSIGYCSGYYFNLIGGFWSQYWTQSNTSNQYKSIDSYQMTNSEYTFGWEEIYGGGLNDLQYIIDQTKESKDWNFYLIATAMQCYGFQMVTDLYGDVPFKEAFKGSDASPVFQPTFNTTQEIYDELIVRLNDATSKDFDAITNSKPASSDLIFGGDMTKWIQFANTLKLKIYLRQMYVRPAVAEAGIRKLYADGASFLTEDAKITQFLDAASKDNPFYAANVRNANVAGNLRASHTLYKYLNAKADTRLKKIYENKPYSLPQGGYNFPNLTNTIYDATKVAVFTQSATDPIVFFSAAESYFLQAEAVAKGWGVGDDKALYDKGVLAAFNKYALSGSSYIAAGGVYEYPSAGSFELKQEKIIMQKWVSMVGTQGIESFFETNRTHYPKVSAIKATLEAYSGGELTFSIEGPSDGKFPKRMIIPNVEKDRNPNTPELKKLTDKVWWDVKP